MNRGNMLTELRKKRVQRIALGLGGTEFDAESNLMFEDEMVYYKPFATSLGILRATKQGVDLEDWHMNKVSATFLYKEVCVAKGVEFSMLRCPSGSFMMGHRSDYYRSDYSTPPRTETIDRPFLLGETEVTQELYYTVVGFEPSKVPMTSNYQLPITCDWNQAVEFCNALSDLYGLERCYIPYKNVILFRDNDPKRFRNKTADNFYDQIIDMLKGLGIENVYLDIDVDDETLINNPFYLVHANQGSAHERFVKVKERLDLRPGYDFSYFQKKSPYRMIADLEWGIKHFVEKIQENPSFDPTKNGYRLPNEKEWEYAAKASTENRYAGTDNEDELTKYAWFWDNASIKNENGEHLGFAIRSVKQKRPNNWGFYDMSGNVSEFCNEIFSHELGKRRKQYCAEYGNIINYVYRGGNYMSSHTYFLRTSSRISECNTHAGFRIARTDFES